MKQVFQNIRTGEISLLDVAPPAAARSNVLIRSHTTLISAGTERMLVEFGKASLLAKARSQPEKVLKIIEKLRSDGVFPTLEAVFSKLDEPMPLGYCSSGAVLDIGPGVAHLRAGDRVASNGQHAELTAVPTNLCASIPREVSSDQAAFTVLASIALQGIRLIQPQLGERVAVIGLGLVGLITVQLLAASGCEVLGIDINPRRLELARTFGARVSTPQENPVNDAMVWTLGRGVDAVIIAASADTNDILQQAALMSRKRGRIVLVGVVGLCLDRAPFYEKELTFQVSCSYGPGRYDDVYEYGGIDYPFGFVRWTEQRNLEAVLLMMKANKLIVDPLITHRFPIQSAPEAYEVVSKDSSALGVLLNYPQSTSVTAPLRFVERVSSRTDVGVGIIGAGAFSKAVLLPAIQKAGIPIAAVSDARTVAATHLARKHGGMRADSSVDSILSDKTISSVVIATGHDRHAQLVVRSLDAGKHVFVEKPLAITVQELAAVVAAAQRHPDLQLMVGYNRRFSPHSRLLRSLLAGRSEPLAMTMTINAGIIPPGNWVHDPLRGGGRIIGEACHFVDFMTFLAGSLVETVAALEIGAGPSIREDKMIISLRFADGSIGTINYFANGSSEYPKETIEVFSDGRVARLVDFKALHAHGFGARKDFRTSRRNKGHEDEVREFFQRVRNGGSALIPLPELVNSSLTTFAAQESARLLRHVSLPTEFGAAFAPDPLTTDRQEIQ